MHGLRTERLLLTVPEAADRDQVFALYADPAVWAADPVSRHDDVSQSALAIDAWRARWAEHGLGMWMARTPDGTFVGVGGCFVRLGVAWNLGYRLVPSAWGHGYAQEICRHAVSEARDSRPDLPVTAYLLEGNDRSRRTVEALGLSLRWRGPDAGNPDAEGVRLLFSDRVMPDEIVERLVAE